MAERVRFELTVHQRCTLDFESNSTVRKHSTPQGRTNKINDLRCASSATNTSKCSKMAENPARLRSTYSGSDPHTINPTQAPALPSPHHVACPAPTLKPPEPLRTASPYPASVAGTKRRRTCSHMALCPGSLFTCWRIRGN